MAENIVIGLDTGKDAFHVWEADRQGGRRVRRQFTRVQLMRYLGNHEPALVGLEACAGSNHLARKIERMGHTARLMSPQHVRPYVKSNKNDFNDAQGVWEAVQRPTMRFVVPKTVEQQELMVLHRAREQVDKQRTALSNQIRGMLAEFGITVARSVAALRLRLPEVLEDADNELTALVREVLAELGEELRHLEQRHKHYTRRLEQVSKHHEQCRRLETIPGIGPMIATATLGKAGDMGQFRNGRNFSAWLGLVPAQHSTGGKTRLGSISKRGDRYLRMLYIHGARALLRVCDKRQDDPLCRWALEVRARQGWNVACVALANKLARIAWAVLVRESCYQPQTAVH